MFRILFTILSGQTARARDEIEDGHAVLILEQKLREATSGHERAKRALATMILRERNEKRALAGVTARIGDLEVRVSDALKAGLEAFANEGAEAIADLERESEVRQQTLERTGLAARRLRLMIEKTDRRLVELRLGLTTARAMEAERGATRELRGDFAGMAAIAEGEAVLKRALERTDPGEELDILDQLDAELSGDDLIERMAAEGLGTPPRTRGADVLARLRAKTATGTDAGQPQTV
ncbi:PspA/IM30 family protein [Maricaulis sp.]|uniref:PspA/IM30 family protein n=1 Tax=Maricaulis sp. TaxID=1486257 RepID=UPI003A8CEC80